VPYLRQGQKGERKMKKFLWKQLLGNSYWRMGVMTLLLRLWLFHLQRTLWPFQSSWGLRDNEGMRLFLLRYLEDLEIQSGKTGLMVLHSYSIRKSESRNLYTMVL
jgi:hypothetical protein